MRDVVFRLRQSGGPHQPIEAPPVNEKPLEVRVWDAPTRLFHWAIVLLLGLSWLTASRGWLGVHFFSGYAIMALLVFRLLWGVTGSETSRFVHFVGSPVAALRHLARLHRQEPDHQIGHNAAGGWMVLVLLALLVVQVGTGLCANDDGATEGPLFGYVGKDWSDWLASIHSRNFTLIQVAVLAHVAAVLAYAAVKRHNLVRPMITGRKRLPPGTKAPALAGHMRAVLVLIIAVGVVAVTVNLP